MGDELGLQLLFEHPAEQKVTSVAYAGADDANTTGVERWQSYHRFASHHGIEVGASFRSEFGVESGVATAEHILAPGRSRTRSSQAPIESQSE